MRLGQCRLALLEGALRALVIIDRLVIIRFTDKLLLVQKLVAFIEFLLIVILRLVAIVGSLSRLKFTGQSHLIHFGYQLSLGHDGVVIHINLVDDARYLRSYFDFRHRLDGTGSGNGIADDTSLHHIGFKTDFMFSFRATEHPYKYQHHDNDTCGQIEFLFLFHI